MEKKVTIKTNSLINNENSELVKTSNLLTITEKLLSVAKYRVGVPFIPFLTSNNKYKLFDYRKKTLSNQEFDKASFFDERLKSSQSLIVESGEYKAIVSDNEDLENLRFYKILTYYKVFPFCVVSNGNLYGVVDDKNNVILPLDFQSISRVVYLDKIFLIYRKNNQFGLYDLLLRSHIIIPNELDKIYNPHEMFMSNILMFTGYNKRGFVNLADSSVNYLNNNQVAYECNEGICTLNENNEWKLLNVHSNKFINNKSYFEAGKMINSFALCRRDSKYFLVLQNGEEIQIGSENEYYERSGDIIYSITDSNGMKKIRIYLKEKFISEFSIKSERSQIHLKSINDEQIELSYWSFKYDMHFEVAIYSLEGIKIEDRPSYSFYKSHNNKELENFIPIEETNWRIENKCLYYHDKLIHQSDNQIEELSIEGFFNGIAYFYEIIYSDPEMGVNSNSIGIIDIEGNTYWEKERINMQTEAIFENIAERIQQEIRIAQKSIFIAVAWFTNKNIFNELLHKTKEGCTVSLIISNDKINLNSSIDFNQLNIGTSKVYKIGNGDTDLMHNKFAIIDYSTIITGSYNWSYKAENNFENVIITKNDSTLAKQFISEFNKIRKQYYPNTQIEEQFFPLDKIIKRLEILKNYVLLEDLEELNKETTKLKDYEFNTDLKGIINELKNKEYAEAINKIQFFISQNQQISIWSDPEVSALKLEIKNLENQLNAFDNEKLELEKVLSEFQYKHTIELGDIILNILNLRKLKFKLNKSKFEDAEKDEKQYRQQFDIEKEKEHFELTIDQKIELKKKFRRATVFCHPDKVADEFNDDAQRVFIDLKKAYDANDLKKVSDILEELEKGHFFKSKSETVQEIDLLKSAIHELKGQIKILESQIIEIKESNTYKTIIDIEDWDSYFNKTKKKLQKELEELKLDI